MTYDIKKYQEKWRSHVRFQVLTAWSMKIVVFWDVAPCSLVEVYRRSQVLAASIIRAMV
jgi:hypothetical protein